MNKPTQSTKERLLDKAVELFSSNGYENVSVNDIATAAGIRASSMYNHYASKDLLLEEIYGYFEKHYFANVVSLDDAEDILRHGSSKEIIDSIMWNFFGLPEDMYLKLVMISEIIYARFLIDDKANQIFLDVMNKQNREDMCQKFNKLVEYGRLPKDFDTRTLAEIVHYIHLMIGVVGVAGLVSGTFEGDIAMDKAYIKTMLADLLDAKMDTELL